MFARLDKALAALWRGVIEEASSLPAVLALAGLLGVLAVVGGRRAAERLLPAAPLASEAELAFDIAHALSGEYPAHLALAARELEELGGRGPDLAARLRARAALRTVIAVDIRQQLADMCSLEEVRALHALLCGGDPGRAHRIRHLLMYPAACVEAAMQAALEADDVR